MPHQRYYFDEPTGIRTWPLSDRFSRVPPDPFLVELRDSRGQVDIVLSRRAMVALAAAIEREVGAEKLSRGETET